VIRLALSPEEHAYLERTRLERKLNALEREKQHWPNWLSGASDCVNKVSSSGRVFERLPSNG
jgi:hypothetical protein